MEEHKPKDRPLLLRVAQKAGQDLKAKLKEVIQRREMAQREYDDRVLRKFAEELAEVAKDRDRERIKESLSEESPLSEPLERGSLKAPVYEPVDFGRIVSSFPESFARKCEPQEEDSPEDVAHGICGIEEMEDEIEELLMQLDICAAAARGEYQRDERLLPSEGGWSPAYEEVIALYDRNTELIRALLFYARGGVWDDGCIAKEALKRDREKRHEQGIWSDPRDQEGPEVDPEKETLRRQVEIRRVVGQALYESETQPLEAHELLARSNLRLLRDNYHLSEALHRYGYHGLEDGGKLARESIEQRPKYEDEKLPAFDDVKGILKDDTLPPPDPGIKKGSSTLRDIKGRPWTG